MPKTLVILDRHIAETTDRGSAATKGAIRSSRIARGSKRPLLPLGSRLVMLILFGLLAGSLTSAWGNDTGDESAQEAPSPSVATQVAPAEDTPGVVLRRAIDGNEYTVYIPKVEPVGILVIVHGTPRPDDVIIELSERFLRRWTAFAEVNRLIAISPAFAVSDFGGRSDGLPFGGYRGLVGRTIRADELLHRIIDRHSDRIADFDGKFYLYGFSAGGQFTSRYIVTHPERIKAAIVCAAGAFAFPHPNRRWPNGMRPATATITANGSRVRVTPNADGWLEAATLPVTVLVGAKDDELQGSRYGKLTRVDLAKRWVDEMNRLAEESGRRGKVTFDLVDGVGHASAPLTPRTQEAFRKMGLRLPADEIGDQ
ncbi:MAG TPA: hypothetical protein DD670_12750 [Planctomycetaceae bacterium]|nr:hypothetical protein [Planctomycetaceae bacterium]